MYASKRPRKTDLELKIDDYIEILSGFYGYTSVCKFNQALPQVKNSFEKIKNSQILTQDEKFKVAHAYFATVRDIGLNKY